MNDESCVGYAVSNFDLLSELWENSQTQISFKHYSFIVNIICFFSYKLLIRSTFCMTLMWYIYIYIWRGCCFTVKYFSLCFFWYEVEFLLSSWLRQCWRKEKIDWLILNQTKCSFTNKIFDEQMYTQAKYMSLTVSIKFINGKIWVFTPLALLTKHQFSNLCSKKII